MVNHRLLSSKGDRPPDPKNAGSESSFCFSMLKEQGCIAGHHGKVESFVHQETNVDIPWRRFRSNERSKDHESSQMSRRLCQAVNSFETTGNDGSLKTSLAKVFKRLT